MFFMVCRIALDPFASIRLLFVVLQTANFRAKTAKIFPWLSSPEIVWPKQDVDNGSGGRSHEDGHFGNPLHVFSPIRKVGAGAEADLGQITPKATF